MTDAPSAAPGIPMWLYHLKGAIHQNLSKPYKKNFDATTDKQLRRLLNSKAHLPLLRWRLMHALLTGPHFPVKHLKHLQSQTWCANTIITFINNLSEGKKLESSFDELSHEAHQSALAHLTTGHALMAVHYAAKCATDENDDAIDENDDAIVAAFTSVAAAVRAANQDVTAFWVWAAEKLVKQLEAAIIQGLTNSH